jgi:hypothetical protein
LEAQGLHLLPEIHPVGLFTAPAGADGVPAEEAVLILGEPRQRHEEDPLLGPTGLSSDGKDLRRYESGFVAGDGFFPPNSDAGSTWAASSCFDCSSRRLKAV